jgi:hypothetical protein
MAINQNMNHMKKIILNRTVAIIAALCLTVIVACEKDEDDTVNLSRQFAPSTVTSTNGETQITLNWTASLFTLPGEPEYVVEVSKDNTFSTIDYTASTQELTMVITDENLAIKQNYFARVKAVGVNGGGDSNWTMSPVVRITGEQFLQPVPGEDISDIGVILRWRPNAALNRIVVTPATGSPIEVTLNDADKAASNKTIMGLTQTTSYSAEIFQDAKTKGITTFSTKASITGNIVDISGTTGNPGLLATTIASAPSGSVIVVRRGEPYNISAGISLNKSITIRSALGFGNNLPVVKMGINNTGSVSFSVAANATIDSVVFIDLVIKGGKLAASYGADYVMNVGNVCTVKKIRLENCTIKMLRGMVRGSAAAPGARFDNYIVNNCVIDSIRDFSIVQATAGSSFGTIRITNSTLYKVRKFINHAATNATSVLIENCTINESPSNGDSNNWLIDFGTFNATGGILIRNTIFGKTWNENGTFQILGYRAGSSTALGIVNSYQTNDFTFTANPLSGLSAYAGASTALFTDPNAGNFKIKDATFVGKSSSGDPRWR